MTRANIRRIVFFGDSICVGQGVSIHKGWVPRVAMRVEYLGKRLGIESVVVNASVNGSTTRQALERLPYEVQSHGVWIFLVQFGMNDCNYWRTDGGLPRVSPASFAANLEEIIVRGVTFGAELVLLNTNHPTTRDDQPLSGTRTTYEASNIAYNTIIRDVAGRFGESVLLNDIENAFRDYVASDRGQLSELLLEDGLHPSEAGHDLYFSCIMPVIEKSILTLAGATLRD